MLLELGRGISQGQPTASPHTSQVSAAFPRHTCAHTPAVPRAGNTGPGCGLPCVQSGALAVEGLEITELGFSSMTKLQPILKAA